MRIGIRYCGGCNAYYDRVKAVEQFMKDNPGHEFLPASDGEHYDAILLVNGCVRCCTRGYREAEAEQYLVMKSRSDFEELSLK